MGQKRKVKKKRPQPVSILSQEQEARLNAFLENLKDINPDHLAEQLSSPDFAEAMVSRLPSVEPEAVNILLAIKEAFPQRGVRKAVKRAAFRLRQKGLSHPELESKKGPQLLVKGEKRPEPSVYVGPVDGAGSRGVFLALSLLPTGVDVGMGVVNDEEGILHFIYGRYSKKRMKEIKNVFFSNFHHVVETSLSHGATILERAYQDSRQRLGQHAGDYLKLRPWILENVPLLEQAAIFDFISADSIPKQALTAVQIDRLMEHKLMEEWIIASDKMRPLMEEIQKVKESRILVSEAQRRDRISELKKRALQDIYPDEHCLRMKGRLEEMGYVFFKVNEGEMAYLSLAAARSMDEKGLLLGFNPFLNAILERSLDFYDKVSGGMGKSNREEDDFSSRIMIP
jgi:hypothetical protein